MPVSARPKQHIVTIRVADGERLVFLFNYPSPEQFAQFNANRYRMIFDHQTQQVDARDMTTDAVMALADELLADFYAEEKDDAGEWVRSEALDLDDQPIDTAQEGWKDKIYGVYKTMAADWIRRLAETEVETLKKSGPSSAKKYRSKGRRSKGR